MSEKSLINDFLLRAKEVSSTLFRNQVGMGWYGKFKARLSNDDVILSNPRPLRAGLCDGSSDLIGWTKTTITQEMVGETVAIFTACEIKFGNTITTDEQKNFVNAVHNAGGIGIVTKTFEDFSEYLLNRFRR